MEKEADNDKMTPIVELYQRWLLNDYMNGHNDEAIKEFFKRRRPTRGKGVTVTRTVTMQSLDTAWTAFVRRWNVECPDALQDVLAAHERDNERLAVGGLTTQISQLSHEQARRYHVMYVADECVRCRRRSIPGPDVAVW
ncbi:hypothetical protein PF005_g3626 [Phytophthora fragariae]|uniref:Uncharacterized protein n=1 Tax=Phytophthora fragariae TaxID=53985 RepID=A0A6A3KSK4_9STRA|nr:hypothetical protein PF003_g21486 [Phytophthora fragariae]KAE8944476.1 hypothetical protein PF009_g5854 [Phytophthora fragariae]KAE9010020.1 hypothetical protein PF011_g10010 [Phytophthora fragariae]KAE9132701.1 hypothetical protein PF007_g3633 [Phytophthora fragariae]KAE9230099.1 hypothetical protein PF005_g3626 [Phytophthora fragariae]